MLNVPGSLAVSNVPVAILSALIAVMPRPEPTNDAAVTIPVVLIFPRVESIPTPKCNGLSGLPPICRVCSGFVVPTPTGPTL